MTITPDTPIRHGHEDGTDHAHGGRAGFTIGRQVIEDYYGDDPGHSHSVLGKPDSNGGPVVWSEREHGTQEGGYADALRCPCGNATHLDGFATCLPDGTSVEPTADGPWDGHSVVCCACGRILRSEDGRTVAPVIGRATEAATAANRAAWAEGDTWAVTP